MDKNKLKDNRIIKGFLIFLSFCKLQKKYSMHLILDDVMGVHLTTSLF